MSDATADSNFASQEPEPEGASDAARTTRTCPKCHREVADTELACARCGLASDRFDVFAAASDPAELAAAWRACLDAWDKPAIHDLALDTASRFGCLPALARRYRERREHGADPVADKRLQQIAVLIETATRAQAREGMSRTTARIVWLAGYVVAAAVMLAAAWVFFIALRRHG